MRVVSGQRSALTCRSRVARHREALSACGEVLSVTAYANPNTLAHVPLLWRQAEAAGMRVG